MTINLKMLLKYLFATLSALIFFGCSSQKPNQSMNIDNMFVKKKYNFNKEIKKLEESYDKKMQQSLESDDLSLTSLSDELDENSVKSSSPLVESQSSPPPQVALNIQPAPASFVESQSAPLPQVALNIQRAPASFEDKKLSRLKYFIENASIVMLRELLTQSRFDLNALAPDGETWLLCAIKAGRLDNARELIVHGANPKLPNAKGEIPESFEEFKNIIAR